MSDASMAFGQGNTNAPAKRGRGRPPGSLNKPKQPPMTALQRQVLKDELGASYRAAIINRMLAETQARGITSLIRKKLGRQGLAEVQAEIIQEHETLPDALPKQDDGQHQDRAA